MTLLATEETTDAVVSVSTDYMPTFSGLNWPTWSAYMRCDGCGTVWQADVTAATFYQLRLLRQGLTQDGWSLARLTEEGDLCPTCVKETQ